MPTTEEQIAQLQRQVAEFTAFGRALLEGKLDGPGSAAGHIVALEGGQTRIDVRLGKLLPPQP
jgi:hypothetical protein